MLKTTATILAACASSALAIAIGDSPQVQTDAYIKVGETPLTWLRDVSWEAADGANDAHLNREFVDVHGDVSWFGMKPAVHQAANVVDDGDCVALKVQLEDETNSMFDNANAAEGLDPNQCPSCYYSKYSSALAQMKAPMTPGLTEIQVKIPQADGVAFAVWGQSENTEISVDFSGSNAGCGVSPAIDVPCGVVKLSGHVFQTEDMNTTSSKVAQSSPGFMASYVGGSVVTISLDWRSNGDVTVFFNGNEAATLAGADWNPDGIVEPLRMHVEAFVNEAAYGPTGMSTVGDTQSMYFCNAISWKPDCRVGTLFDDANIRFTSVPDCDGSSPASVLGAHCLVETATAASGQHRLCVNAYPADPAKNSFDPFTAPNRAELDKFCGSIALSGGKCNGWNKHKVGGSEINGINYCYFDKYGLRNASEPFPFNEVTGSVDEENGYVSKCVVDDSLHCSSFTQPKFCGGAKDDEAGGSNGRCQWCFSSKDGTCFPRGGAEMVGGSPMCNNYCTKVNAKANTDPNNEMWPRKIIMQKRDAALLSKGIDKDNFDSATYSSFAEAQWIHEYKARKAMCKQPSQQCKWAKWHDKEDEYSTKHKCETAKIDKYKKWYSPCWHGKYKRFVGTPWQSDRDIAKEEVVCNRQPQCKWRTDCLNEEGNFCKNNQGNTVQCVWDEAGALAGIQTRVLEVRQKLSTQSNFDISAFEPATERDALFAEDNWFDDENDTEDVVLGAALTDNDKLSAKSIKKKKESKKRVTGALHAELDTAGTAPRADAAHGPTVGTVAILGGLVGVVAAFALQRRLARAGYDAISNEQPTIDTSDPLLHEKEALLAV